jgi:orotidine-5'-phosphate decarboxylase
MAELERKRQSRIILALDPPLNNRNFLLSWSLNILGKVQPYICALKLNRQLVLPLGLFDGVIKILEKAHSYGLPVIMDCKINDIGYSNKTIVENYFKAGFDAVTANPFVGWENGLSSVFEVAKRLEKGVIILVYMSHKAAWEGYGQIVYDPLTQKPKPQYLSFAEKALLWHADGVVVGATYPDKIKEIYTILGKEIPIYSPGVGTQGGEIRTASSSGTRYFIVGRSITYADRPEDIAKTFRAHAFRNQ